MSEPPPSPPDYTQLLEQIVGGLQFNAGVGSFIVAAVIGKDPANVFFLDLWFSLMRGRRTKDARQRCDAPKLGRFARWLPANFLPGFYSVDDLVGRDGFPLKSLKMLDWWGSHSVVRSRVPYSRLRAECKD